MIELIIGENEYALAQYVTKKKQSFKEAYGESGIESHDAEDLQVAHVIDLARGGSLFSSNRLVIIYSPSINKSLHTIWSELVSNCPDDTDIVLVEPKPDKRLGWYKALQKAKRVKEFTNRTPGELATWVQEYAASIEAVISSADARYLVQRVGVNQWSLKNELDKLAAGGGTIMRSTIDDLVEPSITDTVFQLIDAVCAGKGDKAVALYDVLSKKDVDPHQFIALMSWQVNAMLIVKANSSTAPGVIASAAGMAPFVVTKTQRLVAELSMQTLLAIAERVQKADMLSKQTRSDATLIARTLIDQIAWEITS